MIISQAQHLHFQTFGFLILRRVFSPVEMAEISDLFDTLLTKERQGTPFPGKTRQSLYSIVENNDRLIELADDDRISGVVEALYGPDFVWLGSEGNLYVGDTGWHPDGSRLDTPPMKVSLYLDPLTKDTGCLRVMPGSHRLPGHEDLRVLNETGIDGRLWPAMPFESTPGDVLFANMNLWHASFGGRPGRRHLALNFFPAPTTERHLNVMKENYDGLFDFIERLQHSQPDHIFSESFLNSDRPRIRRMTAGWREMGLR